MPEHTPDEQEQPPRQPIGLSYQDMMAERHDRQQAFDPTAAPAPDPDSEPEEGESEQDVGPFIGAARGVGRAANQVYGMVDSFGKKTAEMTGMYKMFRDDEAEKEWLEEAQAPAETLFDISERPGGFWGFYEGAVQFMAGFVPATRAAQGVNVTFRGANFLKAAVSGAVADFSVFDPHEERLANLAQNAPEWVPFDEAMSESRVINYLAAGEDDGELEGRFKNALEGLLLGSTIDALWGMTRAVSAKRAAASGAVDEDAAAEAAADAMSMLEDTPNRAAKEAPDQTPEAFGIRQDEDGMWEIQTTPAMREKLGDDFPEGVKVATREEAERVAASFNMVDRFQRADPMPKEFDSTDRSNFRRVVERMGAGDTSAEAIQALEGSGINTRLIAAEDDVLAQVGALAETLRPMFDEVRAHPTQADLVREAENLIPGASADEIIDGLRIDRARMQEAMPRLLAARMLLWGKSTRIQQLGRALYLDPTNTVALRQLADEFDTMGNLAVNITGNQSLVGRFLKAQDIEVDAASVRKIQDEAAAKESVDRMMEPEAPKDPTFKDAFRQARLSAREVSSLSRALTLTRGDPEAVMRVMKLTGRRMTGADEKTFFDKLVSFRASMMLSGLRTQFVNLVSSSMAAAQVPAEIALGGAISGNKEMKQQGLDMLTGVFADNGHILRQGFTAFRQAFKENRSILDPRYVKDERGIQVAFEGDMPENMFLNLAVKGLGLPGRLLMSVDEFVKRTSYLTHVRSQSLRNIRREAAEQGVSLTPNKISERVYDDLSNAVDGDQAAQLYHNALQHARTVTFTNKLQQGTVGHGLQEMANNSKIVRFIMPFIRTPVNIFRFSVQRFPVLGAAQKEMRDMIREGGEQRAVALGRQAMGTLFYGIAMEAAFNERITGKGPDDPRLRQRMRDSGWQPYSVKMESGYVSFRRLEPIATPLALMADFATFMGDMEEETIEENGVALMTAFAGSVSNKSFLLGLTEFFEAIGSNQEHKMQQFVNSFATSFSPAIARQANLDPYWREANGLWEEIKKDIPGASRTLEPRRNIFGEPVMKTARQLMDPVTGYINESFNPFTVVSAKDVDDTQLDLAKLGRAMTMPSETLRDGEIDLRDREKWVNTDPERKGQSPYDRWLEIMGENGIRAEVEAEMASEAWQNAPAGDDHLAPGGLKFRLINRILEGHKDIAFAQVLDEYPDLAEAYAVHPVNKAEALFSN